MTHDIVAVARDQADLVLGGLAIAQGMTYASVMALGQGVMSLHATREDLRAASSEQLAFSTAIAPSTGTSRPARVDPWRDT